MYDGGHIEEWLRRAKIPQDAVGTVLEAGETHDGPMTDLVEIAPYLILVRRSILLRSTVRSMFQTS